MAHGIINFETCAADSELVMQALRQSINSKA